MGIGELARRTGVNVETIRYYERAGIVPAPPRTEGGHRAYDTGFVRRLTFVARARRLGFSLQEIRSLLRLVDANSLTCADVRELTLSHADEIRRKIADLRQLESTLSALADQCHGQRVPECPVLEQLFESEG